MKIRVATEADWSAIWPFFRQIVTEGETYVYDPAMSEETARARWLLPAPAHVVVAVDAEGNILGTANMYANREGNGAHVASASFMVDPTRHGRGTGRALGQYVIDWAKAEGFRSITFNAVVESNVRAVGLWKSLGFEVVGTVPEGFNSPTHGYVGLHVMHRFV
ncbi:GNAT family N-acetyltransferase [Kribbella sp. NBC_01245]|uniref:GNAT family N-acetyltransferase n=1 Tax=Kribbella sp. NBC_01245 TaxID=2903578 RepID=UPI002E28B2C5|nr:GNAT family N-acetyltransferase [Kribbella sp. NBC_01245]